MPAISSPRPALMWTPSLPRSTRDSSAPSSAPANPKAPAVSPVAGYPLRERRNRNVRSLQRPVPLHRQLGALDHGRGDPEPQRQRQVHGLQRGQSSHWTATVGSTPADRISWASDGGAA